MKTSKFADKVALLIATIADVRCSIERVETTTGSQILRVVIKDEAFTIKDEAFNITITKARKHRR